MKKLLLILAFLFPFAASATYVARTIVNPAQGAALSSAVMRNELQLLENEITAVGNITAGTTTVTCSGSVSCTSFLVFGATPIVISASGGGAGTISTSSPIVSGQAIYATGVSTIASVATSTPSLGSEFSYSGTLGNFLNGSSGSLTLTAGGVALTKLAAQAANTIIANGTGGSAVPTAIATSSLFGTGIGGQVVGWSNILGGLTLIATSSSGGSGTVSSGLAGQLGYYNASGSTIVGTSTNPLYVTALAATTTTATSTFAGGVEIGTTTQAVGGTASAMLTVSNFTQTIGGILINTWTNVVNAFSVVNAAGATVFNIDTTSTNPFLSIGSTTPWATLSVVADGTNPLFVLATSTAANSSAPVFEVDKIGHIITSGPVPSIASCGTSPTIAGNDTNWRAHIGSISATTCTITFATAFATAPVCVVIPETGTLAFDPVSSSTPTNMVISGGTLTGVWIVGHCEAYQ